MEKVISKGCRDEFAKHPEQVVKLVREWGFVTKFREGVCVKIRVKE
jgi:hypothetical protein